MAKQAVQNLGAIFDKKLEDFREDLKTDMICVFNQGFEEIVLPHIKRLDTKVDQIENRLDNVENRLDRVDNRLDGVENRLEQMDRKLDVITGKVFEHDSEIKKLKQRPLTS